MLPFCFRKTTEKSKFSEFLYLQKSRRWLLSRKRMHSFPEKMYLNQAWSFQICQTNFKFMSAFLRFYFTKAA